MVLNPEKRAIRVVVRSRPCGREKYGVCKRPSLTDLSSSPDSGPILQLQPEAGTIRYFPNGQEQGDCQQYHFDAVVDSDQLARRCQQPTASRGVSRADELNRDDDGQSSFYTAHCAPAIRESLLKGHSSCLFAYGQTSAGKTYTMLGEEASNRLASRGANLGTSLSSLPHSDVPSFDCESSLSSCEDPLAQTAVGREEVPVEGEEGGSPSCSCGPKEGVIPRALDEVFRLSKSLLGEQGISSTISISCLEVYKERITDLLNPLSEVVDAGVARRLSESLRLRGRRGGAKGNGDSDMEWYVENLYSTECDSHLDAMKLLRGCIARRRIRSHSLNISSSRSHLVFTVRVRQERRGRGTDSEAAVRKVPSLCLQDLNFPEELKCRTVEINFVDLAGSEKLNLITVGMNGSALSTTHLIEESITINQSLFTLGRVISALADGAAHVPYRESKLTMLLKPALGGQATATMIACIRPTAVDESLSTLLYASRAKKISNEVRQNIDPQTALVLALKQEVESLKRQLSETRSELAIVKGKQPSEYQSLLGVKPYTPCPLDGIGEATSTAIGGVAEDLANKLLDTSLRLGKALEVNAKLRKAFDFCQTALEQSRRDRERQEDRARYWWARSRTLSGLLGLDPETNDHFEAPLADGSVPPPLHEVQIDGWSDAAHLQQQQRNSGADDGAEGDWNDVASSYSAANSNTPRSTRSDSLAASSRRGQEKTPKPPSKSTQGLLNQCLARQLERLRTKNHRPGHGEAPKAAWTPSPALATDS